MARNSIYFSFPSLFLLISVLTLTRGDHNACQQEGPCVCHFDNEQSLNLNHLLPDNKYISASKDGFTFFYHGCTDAEFDVDVQNITGVNTCANPLTLCLFNEKNRTLTGIGYASNSSFQQHKEFPQIQEIAYQIGNLKTVVSLICAGDFQETELLVHSMDKNLNKLHVFSSRVCRTRDYIGMSAGSKLIITFLVLGSVYLFAGSLLNYYLRGARGKEIIPNIDFWTSLPGLVRDGVLFVMNGCNSRMVSTADSYDQI